jgi:hypothetical protein
VSHCNDFYGVSRNTVKDAKRKSREDNPTCSVERQRPSIRSFKDLLNDVVKFMQKRLPCHRAALSIPRRRHEDFLLGIRMEPEFKIHLGDEEA